MGNLGEGLIVALIGILVVMTVLCLIAAILSLFKYIGKLENKDKTTKKNDIEAEPVKIVNNSKSKAAEIDELELIAVITAAIAANMNTSSDNLVVRSLHKVSAWNEEAIREQQSNIF